MVATAEDSVDPCKHNVAVVVALQGSQRKDRETTHEHSCLWANQGKSVKIINKRKSIWNN